MPSAQKKKSEKQSGLLFRQKIGEKWLKHKEMLPTLLLSSFLCFWGGGIRNLYFFLLLALSSRHPKGFSGLWQCRGHQLLHSNTPLIFLFQCATSHHIK